MSPRFLIGFSLVAAPLLAVACQVTTAAATTAGSIYRITVSGAN